MAELRPLQACLDVMAGILFDTNVLITVYHYEVQRGEPAQFLLEIPPSRRYMSLVNVFEFICNQPAIEVGRRRQWLRDKDFRLVAVTDAVSRTFQNSVGATVGCHLLADMMVAATAKVRGFALASRDGYFQGVRALVLVADVPG